MIGLVVVTHCRLASEFKAALEHVVGAQENFIAIDILANEDMENRRQDIQAACSKVNQGAGVILLTDLFGGTPSNLAISLMEENQVEVIAGINLPMLVKLASIRNTATIGDAAMAAREAGQKYIHIASQVLMGNE